MSCRDTAPAVYSKKQAVAGVRGDNGQLQHDPSEDELDDDAISALINFFKLLDRWDLEAKPQ